MTVILPIAAFVVFFPILWVAIVWLISRLGSWHGLAQEFAARGPQAGPGAGETCRWTSGKFSYLSSYNHCLNVTVSGRGVHMEPNSLFQFGHVPLFFPWHAVARIDLRRLVFSHVAILHINTRNGIRPVTLYGNRVSAALAKYAPAQLTAKPAANDVR